MTGLPPPNRVQSWLIALAALSYAAGYPLALVAEWVAGWVLVSVGGIFLLALGVATIRRTTRTTRTGPVPDERPASPGTGPQRAAGDHR